MSPRDLLASLVAVVLDRVAAPAVWRLALWAGAMHLRIVGRETDAPEGTGEPAEPVSPRGRCIDCHEPKGADHAPGCTRPGYEWTGRDGAVVCVEPCARVRS